MGRRPFMRKGRVIYGKVRHAARHAAAGPGACDPCDGRQQLGYGKLLHTMNAPKPPRALRPPTEPMRAMEAVEAVEAVKQLYESLRHRESNEPTNRSFRRLHAGHFTHTLVAWASCAPLAVARPRGIGQGAWALAIQAARGVATRTPPCARGAAPRVQCAKERCRAAVLAEHRIQVQAPTTPEPRNARMDWQKDQL